MAQPAAFSSQLAQPEAQAEPARQAIIQLGNPKLRQLAEPIQDVSAPEIQALIDQLLQTLQQSNGVGIAAPQVGENLQLLIVASRPNPRYPHAPQMEPLAMLNPRLVATVGEPVKDWEGCLSVPGIRGQVPRFPVIEVAYLDRQGQPQHQQLEGFVARIFQHEFDHLQGKVFLDRVESSLELISELEYQKLVQQ